MREVSNCQAMRALGAALFVICAANQGLAEAGEFAALRGGAAIVVDGDTFDLVRIGADGTAEATRIRLWGIDAPERGERGEDQAARRLALLLAAGGGEIECEKAAKRHQRAGSRVVATCWAGAAGALRDSVNCRLIAAGVAVEMPRYSEGRLSGCRQPPRR